MTVDSAAWWRSPAQALDSLICAGRYHVGEHDGRLVAGAGWEPHPRIADTAVLRSVFVDSAHRAGDLAARMMRVAEDDALKAGFTHFLVSVSAEAIGFCRKAGYTRADADDVVLESGARVAYRRMWKHAA